MFSSKSFVDVAVFTFRSMIHFELTFLYSVKQDIQVQNQGVDKFGSFRGLSPWLADNHLLAVSLHGCLSV